MAIFWIIRNINQVFWTDNNYNKVAIITEDNLL